MSEGSEAPFAAPDVSETHISTVFFTADRAYKLLKPVKTSFLDHSTTADRLLATEDEIRLNRRLAPEVYLGSADIIEQGEVVDRLIVMRRLDASRRLSKLLAGGGVDECLRSIAKAIAAFHAGEEPAPDAERIAGRDAVATNWADNFNDLSAVVGSVLPDESLEQARTLANRYLEHRAPLFGARIEDGFVRDGHGDLTAEDIFCTDDGPQILDCLAFDRRLRVADVLADVAFLAMDVDRLTGDGSSRRFLDWYSEFSNEHHPTSLAHHYIAYRANVRAKVAAIRHRQGDPGAAELLGRYHDLCLRHLDQGRVELILIGGTPGTGKTTLARGLSGPLSAMVLSTDELRKDLAGRGHLDRDFSATDEGLYAPEVTERTYTELIRRAGTLLRLGESVILDASWGDASLRRAAEAEAAGSGADLTQFRCVLDPDLARSRIAGRLAAGTDPSDARPELLDELAARFAPWPEAVEIDTGASDRAAVTACLEAMRAEPDRLGQGV